MSRHTELLRDPLPTEPLLVVNQWLAESWKLRQQPNPNSMVIATVDPQGRPSARVVLCKEIVPQPGYLVFYTNYLSRKGLDLARTPRAAVVMHWDTLHRQVRIEGPVAQAPAADSDAYFASRPWQSRLGAWASAQSQPIGARKDLQAAVAQAAKRFGVPVPGGGSEDSQAATDYPIPRPPHWGGYHVWAEAVELWVEGEARIHDRARWTRALQKRADGLFETGPWSSTRLQP
ncbi:MAG TPA: pyridoxamine 5'-phosphate oxidase [Steroidobacteraceae bacterium]|nr:pyridoxamine 5'-phosphate oxidase [Steroidobacteraceae bacterium]